MSNRLSHTQNVFESTFATVTSGGHWFHATRETVEKYVPGLLDRHEYEKLVMDAVTWIESTDSLALILYFALVFWMPGWIAAILALGFWFWWFYNKSAFVNITLTPLMKLFNHDAFQIGLAAIALSFLGIMGYYQAVLFGIIYFFLFKVGLLRLMIDRMMSKREIKGLPLNDRVFKMVLVRYSIYEDLTSHEVSGIEEGLKEAVLNFKERRSKK